MRIYITTSPNRHPIPFNYQQKLVGVFHKWMGPNELHDQLSLYSLSWLSPGHRVQGGLDYPEGASFFVSSPGGALNKQVVDGLFDDPDLFAGMRVHEAILRIPPAFGNRAYFVLQSPVLIKRTIDSELKFYFPQDGAISNDLMTETMRHKLETAGLGHLNISLRFDPDYTHTKTKVATYRGIKNKASFHPIIAEGDPEAITFAWETGLGNSTGIGFGAVK